jgi:hypothetical protein
MLIRSIARRVIAVAAIGTIGLMPIQMASADESIDPSSIEELIYPGGSIDVDKTVGTSEIPPKVDICLLEDETGSFGDDITNLQNPATIAAIFDDVRAESPDSQFAVAGFRDFGDPFVYRLLSGMSPNFVDWESGINGLSASGGADFSEAQYPAIRAAVAGGFEQASCGFRDDPLVARVLIVATDATFHTGGAYGTLATTLAVLAPANVTVIGLKASGAGSELNDLAAATGGSVQALSSDGSNIASAILEGLGNLPVEVEMSSTCADPISTSFSSNPQEVTSGDDAAFTETVSVADGAAGGTYECEDNVSYNGLVSDTVVETKTIHVPGITLTPVVDTNELGFDLGHTVTATVAAGDFGAVEGASVEIEITSGPNVGTMASGSTDANGQVSMTWTPLVDPASLGTDSVTAWLLNPDEVRVASTDAAKEWVDTTPPTATCVETVNPNGNKIPQAPGNGGQAQNQDGFYVLDGADVVWPSDSLDLFVTDNGSGTVFGPYAIGTTIKYTEDADAAPVAKTIGGPNSATDWHIIGTGDGVLTVVDGSGNVSDGAACLVPPAPK